jgi:hypothetical protein
MITPDLEKFFEDTFKSSRGALDAGACPACLARALITIGFGIAESSDLDGIAILQDAIDRLNGEEGGRDGCH